MIFLNMNSDQFNLVTHIIWVSTRLVFPYHIPQISFPRAGTLDLHPHPLVPSFPSYSILTFSFLHPSSPSFLHHLFILHPLIPPSSSCNLIPHPAALSPHPHPPPSYPHSSSFTLHTPLILLSSYFFSTFSTICLMASVYATLFFRRCSTCGDLNQINYKKSRFE